MNNLILFLKTHSCEIIFIYVLAGVMFWLVDTYFEFTIRRKYLKLEHIIFNLWVCIVSGIFIWIITLCERVSVRKN